MTDLLFSAIATNPKKAAFLRSIEDHEKDYDNDDDDDRINFFEEPSQVVPDSQGDSAIMPPTTKRSMDTLKEIVNNRKRKPVQDEDLEKDVDGHKHDSWNGAGNDENRAPAYLRGEGEKKKRRRMDMPRTVSDIRQTLSTLIAPPNAMLPATSMADSDGDDDDEVDISMESSDVGDDDVNLASTTQRRAESQKGKEEGRSNNIRRLVENPFSLARRKMISRSNTINSIVSTTTANTNGGDGEEGESQGGSRKSQVIDRLSVIRGKAIAVQNRSTATSTRLAFANPINKGEAGGRGPAAVVGDVDEDFLPPMAVRRALAASRMSCASGRNAGPFNGVTGSRLATTNTATTAGTNARTGIGIGMNNDGGIKKKMNQIGSSLNGAGIIGIGGGGSGLGSNASGNGSTMRLKGRKGKNCSVNSLLRRTSTTTSTSSNR